MADTQIHVETPTGQYKRNGVIPPGHGGDIARFLREQRERGD